MSLPDSYTQKPGSIAAYFDTVLDAQPPERFSIKFLENLGFTSTNDRLFISILKDLGFLNADGVPQQRYYDFMDRSRARFVLAEAIREAFSDLFAVNMKANELLPDDVKNKLRTLYAGKKTDNVIDRIAKTFSALCEYADFSKPAAEGKASEEDKTKKKEEPQQKKPDHGIQTVAEAISLDSLQYHINIVLPERREIKRCMTPSSGLCASTWGHAMDNLYSFIYRGVLTEEALDKVGRHRRKHFGAEEAREIERSLCYDLLEPEHLVNSQRMSTVYAAIHAFENMVRDLVTKAMAEHHGEEWWQKVPERIRTTVKTRMEEDAKFRWHGARGTSEMNYCDFSDLSSIIVTNWAAFEDILANLEWAKAVLSTLEKSRNITMHGGVLAKEDVERIGMNIRDWTRQTG